MLLTKFINNIRDNHLLASPEQLLIAVSGGVDSVVLCELCYRAGYRFQLAHANFNLRGEESEADELFVRGIADKYQVPVHVKKFDTVEYSEKNKVSIQVAARELRYAWFSELMSNEINYLITAHHAGDNIETVLMNFFRGTGIGGLRGILPVSGKIVRPLLPFSKEEIIQFANEQQLKWREDSSNSSEKYSRNYFRNALIPMVTKIFPEAEQNLVNNIRRFGDIEMLYNQAIAVHKKKLLEVKGNEIHIPVLKLLKVQPLESVVYEIIREYNFTAHQTEEVIHLLQAEQGKFVRSTTHRIFKNRNWLIIAPEKSTEAANILIEEGQNNIAFENGRLHFEKKIADKVNISSSQEVACLNASKMVFPLLLRKWKQGDYFYPLGLGKKKKISRFLIDLKMSPTAKEKVWVLETEKKICWVVGLRIDERFRVEGGGAWVVRRET